MCPHRIFACGRQPIRDSSEKLKSLLKSQSLFFVIHHHISQNERCGISRHSGIQACGDHFDFWCFHHGARLTFYMHHILLLLSPALNKYLGELFWRKYTHNVTLCLRNSISTWPGQKSCVTNSFINIHTSRLSFPLFVVFLKRIFHSIRTTNTGKVLSAKSM